MHGTPPPSGRDIAARTYEAGVQTEAAWLRHGARHKVDSISTLLASVDASPRSLVELGCGTGAVLLECQRRGLAEKLTGIDYSVEAIAYLKAHSMGIDCIAADLMEPVATLRTFDAVVVSHVLEHLEEPEKLLRSVQSRIRFRYLIAEVPLEDLWGSRIKNLVRDRRANPAGHVQFFTPTSFERLIESTGLRIERRHHYAPVLPLDALDMLAEKDRVSWSRRQLQRLSGHYLPRIAAPWWKRFYYGHYAVLCTSTL